MVQRDTDHVLQSFIEPKGELSITDKLRRGVLFDDWDENYIEIEKLPVENPLPQNSSN